MDRGDERKREYEEKGEREEDEGRIGKNIGKREEGETGKGREEKKERGGGGKWLRGKR